MTTTHKVQYRCAATTDLQNATKPLTSSQIVILETHLNEEEEERKERSHKNKDNSQALNESGISCYSKKTKKSSNHGEQFLRLY